MTFKFPQSHEIFNPISFARVIVVVFLHTITVFVNESMEKQGAPCHVRKSE